MARRDHTGKQRKIKTGTTVSNTTGSGGGTLSGGTTSPAYHFVSFIASVGGEYIRNGNVTEISGSNYNFGLKNNGQLQYGFAFGSNIPSSPYTMMMHPEEGLPRSFNPSRKDHLGNIHHKIEVTLATAPAHTIFPHGIDTSKIIYYNWYTASPGKAITMCDTGYPFMRPSYEANNKVSAIIFDSTNIAVDTLDVSMVAESVIFEIITTP
jgi:hypothetical protein